MKLTRGKFPAQSARFSPAKLKGISSGKGKCRWTIMKDTHAYMFTFLEHVNTRYFCLRLYLCLWCSNKAGFNLHFNLHRIFPTVFVLIFNLFIIQKGLIKRRFLGLPNFLKALWLYELYFHRHLFQFFFSFSSLCICKLNLLPDQVGLLLCCAIAQKQHAFTAKRTI